MQISADVQIYVLISAQISSQMFRSMQMLGSMYVGVSVFVCGCGGECVLCVCCVVCVACLCVGVCVCLCELVGVYVECVRKCSFNADAQIHAQLSARIKAQNVSGCVCVCVCVWVWVWVCVV